MGGVRQGTQISVKLLTRLSIFQWPREVVNVADHEGIFQQTGEVGRTAGMVMQRECQK